MIKYYVVDAFAEKLFSGNPAGVCILDSWLETSQMQNIAAENNLAETAFAVKNGDHYDLRWFTPGVEIDLCGHATLAAAFIIMKFVDEDAERLDFHTKSGILTVVKNGDLYEMNFPSRKPDKIDITSLMRQSIDVDIQEAYLSRDLLLVVESADQVRGLKPNLDIMKTIPEGFGLIVSAKGDDGADFVSRFFVPKGEVPEDPVTGSAHATLIPFWSDRLGKKKMIAHQLSKRGGILYCEDLGDRVSMSGYAKLYLEGTINI